MGHRYMKCQYAVSINTYKRVIWHEAQSSYTAVHLVNNAMGYHLYHGLISFIWQSATDVTAQIGVQICRKEQMEYRI